jgi:cytosine/uracil/thiamine/allantoin permease
MDDRFTKYSKLYFLIFLLFLSVPVIIGLFVAVMYGLSTLVSSRPIDMLYELLIISLAPSIFATVYFIFFKRTKNHPKQFVKIISYIVFVIGFCSSVVVLVKDYTRFFNKQVSDTGDYWGFGLIFLAGNVAALFTVAILQAFTANKEEDWLEKRKNMQE